MYMYKQQVKLLFYSGEMIYLFYVFEIILR